MKTLFWSTILLLAVTFNANAQSEQWTYQQGYSQGVSICNGNDSHVETLFTNSIDWAIQNGQFDYANGLREAWEACNQVNRGEPVNGTFNLVEWLNSLGTLDEKDKN